MTGLHQLSVAEVGARLRSGSLTARALTDHAIARIGRLDPIYRSFVAVTAERAFAAAERADRELERGLDRGPLQGIPYAVKDLIDVAGVATTGHSRLLRNNVARNDAAVVARLDAAGAVLLGKTATYELGIEPRAGTGALFAPARNPHRLDRSTGGSSSGSAAAIAGGLVRLALGTDSGGSIRGPAAYCGVVGLKPTYGRVSRRGVYPLSASLDHVGPMAASVHDAALMLDAIAGYDPEDEASADAAALECVKQLDRGVSGLRIAYARDFHAEAGRAEVHLALDRAVESIAGLGAAVEEVQLPDHRLFDACATVILQAQAYALHERTLRTRPGDYGPLAFQHLAAGAVLNAGHLARAQGLRRLLTTQVDEAVFSRFDAMITANVLGTALSSGSAPDASLSNPMRVFPFNVTGHPALALPIGFAADGLPIGMQLVGRRFGEAMICRIGAAYERSCTAATIVEEPAELSGLPEHLPLPNPLVPRQEHSH